jgi:hypothetical protein
MQGFTRVYTNRTKTNTFMADGTQVAWQQYFTLL